MNKEEQKQLEEMKRHLVSAVDWIEKEDIRNLTASKILSRWASVEFQLKEFLKKREEEIKIKEYTVTFLGKRYEQLERLSKGKSKLLIITKALDLLEKSKNV